MWTAVVASPVGCFEQHGHTFGNFYRSWSTYKSAWQRQREIKLATSKKKKYFHCFSSVFLSWNIKGVRSIGKKDSMSKMMYSFVYLLLFVFVCYPSGSFQKYILAYVHITFLRNVYVQMTRHVANGVFVSHDTKSGCLGVLLNDKREIFDFSFIPAVQSAGKRNMFRSITVHYITFI